MTADIIPFPAARAVRPPPPLTEDRAATSGDRVVVLASGEVGDVIGWTWAGGVTKALVSIDGGFTRAIHPIRIAPLARGPQPGGSAA